MSIDLRNSSAKRQKCFQFPIIDQAYMTRAVPEVKMMQVCILFIFLFALLYPHFSSAVLVRVPIEIANKRKHLVTYISMYNYIFIYAYIFIYLYIFRIIIKYCPILQKLSSHLPIRELKSQWFNLKTWVWRMSNVDSKLGGKKI